jgi:hypothetical protein
VMAYASNKTISTTKMISIREPRSLAAFCGLSALRDAAIIQFCLRFAQPLGPYGPASTGPLSLSENEFSGLQPSRTQLLRRSVWLFGLNGLRSGSKTGSSSDLFRFRVPRLCSTRRVIP